MNILYCGDEGISRGVLVSILSLIKNGQKRYDAGARRMVEDEESPAPIYNIYIMTIRYDKVRPFQREMVKFLDGLVKKENPKSFVKLIDATDAFVASLPKKNMESYFTPCSMLRLYIDKVPKLRELDRILYMDYDVVCRGDIGDFYNMNLDGIEVAGVLDIYGRRWYHYNGLRKRANDPAIIDARVVGEKEKSFLKQDYMNSGVMLFNVPECVRTGMFAKARELCMRKRMLLADQAALNKAISRRVLAARKYNEQEERPREDTVLHHFSNNFKFWPYFRVQKVKPFEVEKVHKVLKIYEYDDILEKYLSMQDGNVTRANLAER